MPKPEVLSWLGKMRVAKSLSHPHDVIAAAKKALELEPKLSEAYGHMGEALMDLGRNDEALQCFDRALAVNPSDQEAWVCRAAACEALGLFDEAIRSCDELIRRNPRNAHAHFNRGNALVRAGRQGEAMECYLAAIEADPTYAKPFYNAGSLWASAGLAANDPGAVEKAVAFLVEAERLGYVGTGKPLAMPRVADRSPMNHTSAETRHLDHSCLATMPP